LKTYCKLQRQKRTIRDISHEARRIGRGAQWGAYRTPGLQPDLEGQSSSATRGGNEPDVTAASFAGRTTCGNCHGPNPHVGFDGPGHPVEGHRSRNNVPARCGWCSGSGLHQSCYFCHTGWVRQRARAAQRCFWGYRGESGVDAAGARAARQFRDHAGVPAEQGQHPMWKVVTAGQQHQAARPWTPRRVRRATRKQLRQFPRWAMAKLGTFHTITRQSSDMPPIIPAPPRVTAARFCGSDQGPPRRWPAHWQDDVRVCPRPHNAQGFPESAHQVRFYGHCDIGDTTLASGHVKTHGRRFLRRVHVVHRWARPADADQQRAAYLT